MKYITPYKYAKKHGQAETTVNWWVKNGKFNQKDIQVKKVFQRRTFIRENALPIKR